MARDKGRCHSCGKPGSEVDHIQGASNDPENLQWLCRECHKAKTRLKMVRASDKGVAAIHEPILRRASQHLPRQPSDSAEWKHRVWVRGVTLVEVDLSTEWLAWLADVANETATPAQAAAGFPDTLSPWSWYAMTGKVTK